jgi:hypothetical protein
MYEQFFPKLYIFFVVIPNREIKDFEKNISKPEMKFALKDLRTAFFVVN